MHRTIFYMLLLLPALQLAFACTAQNQPFRPDLNELNATGKIKVLNRGMTMLSLRGYSNGIHLNQKEGMGITWLTGIHFTTGVIELDIKGRDLMQQSFVGLAFHGANDSTMDAVYFRPFNFQSPDSIRKNHSVQYISLPAYDWPTLREKFPGKYEQAISPSPQPNDWVHVRMLIDKNSQVSVYVNKNRYPSLVVTALNNRRDGMIGFWTGNNSEGDFANLSITGDE